MKYISYKIEDFDSHGNWITKKRHLNKEVDSVWERAIEYYP